MKPWKTALALLVLAAGALSAGPALAWGGHHGGARVTFGFHFGVPMYWPGPYYSPYYYPPPYYAAPVVIQSQPPVYVERSDAAPAPQQSQNYWYYCADSRTYYPYVKECPGGWQRVSPTPPG